MQRHALHQGMFVGWSPKAYKVRDVSRGHRKPLWGFSRICGDKICSSEDHASGLQCGRWIKGVRMEAVGSLTS